VPAQRRIHDPKPCRLSRESRNAGLSAAVSVRALIMRAPIVASFTQEGTHAHRMREARRIGCCASCLITGTFWVGGDIVPRRPSPRLRIPHSKSPEPRRAGRVGIVRTLLSILFSGVQRRGHSNRERPTPRVDLRCHLEHNACVARSAPLLYHTSFLSCPVPRCLRDTPHH
jgi:hypothetical protein